MTSHIDPFTEEFIKYCRTTQFPVLEIGSAYGIATLQVLKTGAQVIANDLDSRHLDILYESTPQNLRSQLQLIPGRFPTDLQFKQNYFGGILSSRMLHLLPPQELSISFEFLYKWLKPGGKLFIIVDTPFLKLFEKFLPIYNDRVKRGERWPGFIEKTSDFLSSRFEDVPDFVNLLDIPTLENIIKDQDFLIEKIEYIARPDFPLDLQLDGRESIGVILKKKV